MSQRPFWYPLSWWQALAVFFAAQIVAGVSLALLRSAGLLDLPGWVSGGLGGGLGVIGVSFLAKRAAKGADAPPP